MKEDIERFTEFLKSLKDVSDADKAALRWLYDDLNRSLKTSTHTTTCACQMCKQA